MSTKDDKVMRSFDTGATRDTAEGKLDMEGFTHPMVEKQFAKYMNMNRLQSDGQLRDSDNWQKGIPQDAYIKSLRRHADEMWQCHRGFPSESGVIAALCGIIFNVKGYLLEHLKYHDFKLQDFDGDEPTPEMKARHDGLRRKNASPPVAIDTQQKLIEFIDTDIPSNVLRLEKLQEEESIHDAMKVHDDALMEPMIKQRKAWCEEISEVLEDVPELPTCFRCDNDCTECRDEPDCTTHPCNACDFTEECGDLHPEDGTNKWTVEEAISVRSCCGCISLDKTWKMWPCCECSGNPFVETDKFKHSFYCNPERISDE
jgi:hypothetical protein